MSPKIGVLLGGRSAEREVSLRTGEAIYKALLENGYEAVKIDVGVDIAEKLKQHGIELAFIALHGKYGEDGAVQGMLEMLDIPYTGPDVLTSAIAMNKIVTKKILLAEGIPTPDYCIVGHAEYHEKPLSVTEQKIIELGLPAVIKAPTQGSTIGITFVHARDEIKTGLETAFKYDRDALVEEMIPGIEITASVLGNDEPRILPLIEIVSNTGVYDYEAKYTAGMSEHIIPPRVSADIQARVSELARQTYLALGCRGLSRVDFMVDGNGLPYVLEVNTSPGMTETSLFPDAARAAGISFPDLVKKLVRLAGG